MKKAKVLCAVLSLITLLCCLTGLELSVAAVNIAPTQEIYFIENLYFSSKYIPFGINSRAINSSELYTTAGLPLDEYWRVDDEMYGVFTLTPGSDNVLWLVVCNAGFAGDISYSYTITVTNN